MQKFLRKITSAGWWPGCGEGVTTTDLVEHMPLKWSLLVPG